MQPGSRPFWRRIGGTVALSALLLTGSCTVQDQHASSPGEAETESTQQAYTAGPGIPNSDRAHQVLEGENATKAGGVVNSTANSGWLGTGVADFPATHGGAPAPSLSFSVTMATAGKYAV